MRKLLLGLVLLFGTSTVFAADIPKESRVPNREPGYCCWCCIDTLARHLNIKKLKNIAQDRDKDPDFVYGIQLGNQITWFSEEKNSGSELAVSCKLDSLRVKYRYSHFDRDHLAKAAVDGGVVYMKKGSFGDSAHAIVVTGYNEKEFKYIDPNDCKEHKVTRQWFDKWWSGVTLTLEAPGFWERHYDK